MELRQFGSTNLGYHTKLVIGDSLEKRLGKQVQTLHFISRRASILSLMVLTQGIDSLLNERLAGLNHPNESPLAHRPLQSSKTASIGCKQLLQ
ncbi:hypothetical protein D3C81_585520 [compost metagenome]